MEKLLILDSNSLLNRAFYAIPTLTTSDGVNTNAVYGFTNMIFKLKTDINPDFIVAAFDKKGPTFRHKEYGEYKAGRKKMPPELSEQFPIMKDVLKHLAISIYDLEGFEADDVIGALAKYAEKNNIEVYIVTGDRDALQLASKNITVMITKKGVTEMANYTEDVFIEEFGVTPTQYIDVKGLMGDSSDNIPGVPGIGNKTAFKLIQTYGSVEGVLSNIDNISGKKIKENLTTYAEQAVFSKKLATIITEIPMEFDLDDIRSQEVYNKETTKKLFLTLGLKSLVSKLPDDGIVKEEEKIEISEVSDIKALNETLNNKGQFNILYKIENSNVYSKMNLTNLYISLEDKVYNINVSNIMSEDNEKAIEILKAFMEDESKTKVIHDGKALITYFKKLDIEVKGFIFDIAIAAYLINSARSEYSLVTLINENLGIEVTGDEDEANCKAVANMSKVYDVFKDAIEKEDMEELYYSVELPLITVLASMEAVGFNVNKDKLNELGVELKSEIDKTEKEIYEFCDEEFNIGSPKQLGKILFEKLDLPVVKKTKTGYSTNAEVLEKLKSKHPVIEKIIYYRQITKLYSTYIEGLKNVIDEDGRIHSSFNQTVTTTGRLSSTEPNLQNIPIKYEKGREIRKVFIPKEKGDTLLSCDYSQIELRVLADMSNDANMIDAFTHHSDIHTKTASEVFKVDVDEVTSLMRSRAKAVNFGIVYGISDFSLAQDLKITKKEASEYMEIYFDRYPNIKGYLEGTIEEAKEKGFVLTVLNRRRFIPEVKSVNKIVKSLGERLAMNAPIQGSAADIIKLAMVKVYNRLKKEDLQSEIILQVHDELILNVKENELEQVKELVKFEMENVLKMQVPLDVDMSLGNTWYDAK